MHKRVDEREKQRESEEGSSKILYLQKAFNLFMAGGSALPTLPDLKDARLENITHL